MPLNGFDAHFHSFTEQVLPEVNRRGMAALGMKPLSGHGDPIEQGELSADEALRYAMSLPVTTTITGIDKPEVLQQNLKISQGFKPMTAAEMHGLRERPRQAAGGRGYKRCKRTLEIDKPRAR